ncbi:hypothetical protein HKCCE3408_03750 [Rhodobacterales bacterium HKCCE3408]|nr:hypothetical protein [Rhodobacterales bacterium HKCCE3408]
MAAPLAPAAGIVLKYAAIAAAGYLLARSLPQDAPDLRAEAALDDMPDGIGVSAQDGTSRARARWRRTVTLGTAGLRFDAGLIARLKVARA